MMRNSQPSKLRARGWTNPWTDNVGQYQPENWLPPEAWLRSARRDLEILLRDASDVADLAHERGGAGLATALRAVAKAESLRADCLAGQITFARRFYIGCGRLPPRGVPKALAAAQRAVQDAVVVALREWCRVRGANGDFGVTLVEVASDARAARP